MHGGENGERYLGNPGSSSEGSLQGVPQATERRKLCHLLCSFPILCSLSDYKCGRSYLFILDMLNIWYAKYTEPKKLRVKSYMWSELRCRRIAEGTMEAIIKYPWSPLCPNSGFIKLRQEERLKSEGSLGDTSSFLVNKDFAVVLCLSDLENLQFSVCLPSLGALLPSIESTFLEAGLSF